MAASTTLKFSPAIQGGPSCEVRSPLGYRLTVSGSTDDLKPRVDGDDHMTGNLALVENAWAFALHKEFGRLAPTPEEQKSHRKQEQVHKEVVERIAPLLDSLSDEVLSDWCSGCFTYSDHVKVAQEGLKLPAYICATCGTPTITCVAPGCGYMAVRGSGSIRLPSYCAEHSHKIPSFERSADKVARLEDYATLYEYDERNLARATRVAAVAGIGAGVLATAAVSAAPAIGGLISSGTASLTGGTALYGAAASSHGLALLGGGAASGGALAFGVTGGTYVVTVVGAALGGALGTTITNAYLSEDKSFSIELFRDGPGIPVLVARGWLTESSNEWSEAMQTVERRYPDSPIYRVHWGSKELKSLAGLALKGGGGGAAGAGAFAAGRKASKTAAKKVPFLGGALTAAEVAKNPWHTAVVRADKTGVLLAGILARTEIDRCILVGHSLGGRAMITAAESLGTDPDAPRIQTLHTLGAAEGKKGDWRPLNDAVEDAVHNYFSRNDKVLELAYRTAQAGGKAVGRYGFGTAFPKIHDHEVTDHVGGHTEYFGNVTLR